jgi:hypothetical protein
MIKFSEFNTLDSIIHFMTQILLSKYDENHNPPNLLIGPEAKNPVPSSLIPGWEEIRGLSWVFYEDD